MRVPVSTYRLQFNRDFRFSDALNIIDYLDELGITDLYASPLLKARPGSTHGYDVTDPSQLNPELGTPEEFDELWRRLQSKGMGLLLDIVPNHMAASPDNPWWFDVLAHGEASPYAPFFDINWAPGKVLVPILGKTYGEALEAGELSIGVEHGRPVLRYYEQRLPLSGPLEDAAVDGVDRMLSRQHYRLAYWRNAAESINYRRFFDISDLVGLRADRENVFHATHDYILNLLEQGKVTGLRIDHIDGLLDPKGYLDRLPAAYVVTEKILGGNEQLPCDWRTQGTTGYDFLNYLNGVFIDREGFKKLESIYAGFTGSAASYVDVFRERKRQLMWGSFSGELKPLGCRLEELARDDRRACDLPACDLTQALEAATACLPIYRTYIRSEDVSPADRAYIENAVAAAGRGAAYEFLKRVLLVEPAPYVQDISRCKADYLDFVMRWQQFTGPVMAKGLEDTTFYVHNPLISVNEVGGDCAGPETYFGVEQFHRRNVERRAHWPQTMNASSTHDAKRSEDVRARINVLSEMPDEWARFLRRWKAGPIPAPNEVVLIYQSLLGAWPVEPERLKQYVTKALREGKTNTSWIHIDDEYERNVLAFVDSLYANERFLKDAERIHKKLAYFGALSSLSQLILKATSPGVPDFYRGTELWELSLADPDNRRPLDLASRMSLLQELKSGADPRGLLKSWRDGRLKMYVAFKLLHLRRQNHQLFAEGEYIPLRVSGPHSEHVVAFARRRHDDWLLVAVSRLCASLARPGRPPVGRGVWEDTRIEMPAACPSTAKELFTGRTTSGGAVAELFEVLPFAVLTNGTV